MKKKKSQTPNDEFEINLNRALRFLAFRPRSEKEIRQYLRVKSQKPRPALQAKTKNDDKIINLIINKLKEHKFLNDEEFAKWWIEQRTAVNPKPQRIIKLELRQKGISDDIIQNSDFGIQNDEKVAIKLAEKRMQKYKNLPRRKILEKLGRYLVSKGFDYDTIKRSIDAVLPR
ncbi:MAG: RecX family transcriptional regulator [Patescibacteria group bacterium]|nr:RecX family transcriptional regulator [Patescibacteria group bacterium]